MHEISACPFCGALSVEPREVDFNSWMVECSVCLATGPLAVARIVAIETWNSRRDRNARSVVPGVPPRHHWWPQD